MGNSELGDNTSVNAADNVLSWKTVLGFSFGLLGVNISFAMVSSYLPYFYTDVFLLSPAIMAVLFASCRIWDGITDPILGMLADGTNTRWGKFRPYLLMTPIPMIFLFSMTFYVPDLSTTAKVVWAFVTYFSLQMCKTAVAVPYYALPAVITSSSQERTKISGVQQVLGSLAFLAVVVFTLPIVSAFDTEKQGFLVATLIFGGLGAISLWVAFFATRRYDLPADKACQEDKKAPAYTTRQKIGFLLSNKPLMTLMVPIVLYFIITAIILAMGIYFFKYNLQMFDLYPAFMGIFILAMILGAGFAPVMVKKLGKLKVFHITNVLDIVLLIVAFFIAYGAEPEALAKSWNIGGLSFILIILSVFFSAFQQVLFPAMVLDCVEYGEWKSGVRMEGLLNSAYLIANKGGMAIGGFVVGLGLSMIGYQPNLESYSSEMLNGITIMYLLVPLLARLAMSFFMSFYHLNEARHHEIVLELNKRQAVV